MGAETRKCGLLGSREVMVEKDGSVVIPVIIQESGLFVGVPPLEVRIHSVGFYGDNDFNIAYVASLNRKTDLPFFLGTAKIKVDPASLQKITDADLSALGIEPLAERNPFERKLEDYPYAVYGTQGGGLVRRVGDQCIFVTKPKCSGFDVGDTMPEEWDIQPANALARAEMEEMR